MAKNSRIAWTEHTFNPWWGCTKITRGCKQCYAAAMAPVYGWSEKGESKGKFPIWGAKAGRRLLSDANWAGPLKWDREAAASGAFTPVFSGSMCDVFETHQDPEWQETLNSQRTRLWDLIERTPNLTWLLLTKRPENIMTLIPERWRSGLPSNVWVGATMEDQDSIVERSPYLAKVPAVVRWASIEPQVEHVDITPAVEAGVTWFISGGESGPKATPYDLEWGRSIIRQCREHNVIPFIKQLGEVWGRQHQIPTTVTGKGGLPQIKMLGTHGDEMSVWPEDLRVREWPDSTTTPQPAPDDERSAAGWRAWVTRRRMTAAPAPIPPPVDVPPPTPGDAQMQAMALISQAMALISQAMTLLAAPPPPPRDPPRDPRRETATHEAGHALLAHLSGGRITSASIASVRGADGRVLWEHDRSMSPQDRIAVSYGGVAAVMSLSGSSTDRHPTPEEMAGLGGSGDEKNVRQAMRGVKKGREALKQAGWDQAVRMLRQHWHQVQVIADALLARNHLTGDEVVALIREEMSHAA